MKFTKEYYLMYKGSCVRIPLTKSGKVDEWPFNKKRMKKCPFSGGHPHQMIVEKEKVKRGRIMVSILNNKERVVFKGMLRLGDKKGVKR